MPWNFSDKFYWNEEPMALISQLGLNKIAILTGFRRIFSRFSGNYW